MLLRLLQPEPDRRELPPALEDAVQSDILGYLAEDRQLDDVKCCGALYKSINRARDREAIEALMSSTYTVEDVETDEKTEIPVVSEQIRALMDQVIYTAC